MNDDELLRRYLLGELAEDEADRLEQRLLADDELFELAEAVEADLLAACARGELAPEERERALLRLASSPQGRERLALAQGLTALASRSTVVPFPVRTPPLARPAVRWAAVAAALVVMAGGSWFLFQEIRTPAKPSERVADDPSDRGGQEEQEVISEDSNQVDSIGMTSDTTVEQSEQGRVAEIQEPEKPEVLPQLFLLALGNTRDDTGAVPQLVIEPDTQRVEIRVDITEMGGFESFSAVLRNKSTGTTTWTKNDLEPRQLDWGPVLVLDLPVDALPSGIYELTIQGSGADGQTEDAVEFKVVHGS